MRRLPRFVAICLVSGALLAALAQRRAPEAGDQHRSPELKPQQRPSDAKSHGPNASPQPVGDIIGPLSRIIAPPANHSFADGESYVYSAEWRLWNAGMVTLGLSSSADQLHINGSAESRGFVSVLYPVHDRFQATSDRGSFCSQNIRKHVEEGFHARDTLITFDYGRRKSLLEETNLKNKQIKRMENDIPHCVTDVLSAIYYLGSLPLAPEATYSFPLNDGGQTVNVNAKVEGRENVKVPAGTFQTIRVSPEALGPLKSKGKIWIWYSDDSRRIPVQMRGRMFWGTLTFKLQRIEKK